MANDRLYPVYGYVDGMSTVKLLTNQVSSINFDGVIEKTTEAKTVSNIVIGDAIYVTEDSSLAPIIISKIEIDSINEAGDNGYFLYYFNELGQEILYPSSSAQYYLPNDQLVVAYEDPSISSFGTTGWAITKSGNAVFSNVFARGEIHATSGSIKNALYLGDENKSPISLGTNLSITGSNYAYNGLLINDNNYFLTYDPSPVLNVTAAEVLATTADSNLSSITLYASNTLSAGDLIQLYGFTGDYVDLNRVFDVSSATSTTITIIAPRFSAGTNITTTGAEFQKIGVFQRISIAKIDIANTADVSVNKIRFTTSAAHGLVVGDDVTLYDITHADLLEMNGTFVIADKTSTTFDIVPVSLDIATYTISAHAKKEAVDIYSIFKVGSSTNYMQYLSDTDVLSVTGTINATSGYFLNGYFGGTNNGWKVSTNTIESVGGTNKVYLVNDTVPKISISSNASSKGTHSTSDTPFYADGSGNFSLSNQLVFNPSNGTADDFGELTVNGKIRGAIENVTLIPSNKLQVAITGVNITSSTAATITTATHAFLTGEYVSIEGLTGNAAAANGIYQITVPAGSNTTFTITITGGTVSNTTGITGANANIRELTLGLHPSESGYHNAGIGIRLDKYNWWFTNNQFRVGTSGSYIKWDGSTLDVTGTINAKAGKIGTALSYWYIGGEYYDGHGTIASYDHSTSEFPVWDGTKYPASVEIDSTGYIHLHPSGGVLNTSLANGIIFDVNSSWARMWFGNGNETTSTGVPLWISPSGVLNATGANITGTVTASSGTIGGFTIGSASLYTGTSPNIVGIIPASLPFFAGATDNIGTSAKFKVTNAGALTATGANISGAITATSGTFTSGVFTSCYSNTGFDSYDGSTDTGSIWAKTSGTFAGDVFQIGAYRASSTAFDYINCYGNIDLPSGSRDRNIRMRGDGRISVDPNPGFVDNGADYAEYFEWDDMNLENEDRVGYVVVLNEIGKIEKFNELIHNPSQIVGVISATPGVVGNAADLRWMHKYITDDFGRKQLEDYSIVQWTENKKLISYQLDMVPQNVIIPEQAEIITHDSNGNKLQRYIINPEWDPSQEYLNRESRPEWDMVGMLGIIRIRSDQYIKPEWVFCGNISNSVKKYFVK